MYKFFYRDRINAHEHTHTYKQTHRSHTIFYGMGEPVNLQLHADLTCDTSLHSHFRTPNPLGKVTVASRDDFG